MTINLRAGDVYTPRPEDYCTKIAAVAPNDRPSVIGHLPGVDHWTPETARALARAANDPQTMVTLALVSPEYVIA